MGVTQRTSAAMSGPDDKVSDDISSPQPASSDGSMKKEVIEEELVESADKAAEKGQAATDKFV